ncbi:MAG: threonine/serine dehydratase [Gammaproteobacteria bacterium]|nr:threonine/serine dehydratase [Gammaproteobacteria bacterium]NNC56236.1 threonine/serine dehydratase [Woeseiaceae bacterium]
MIAAGPDIADIGALRERLAQKTTLTPVIRCAAIEDAIGGDTQVYAKLEFLQRTGTFKARGALATLYALTPEQLAAGVTAVSAGNHAIATAFAAQAVGTTAKVVMTRSANPSRVEACRSYGAEVVLADDVHQAFAVAEGIQETEGRYFVHPFEGPAVALGTGTLGLEICEQCSDFDAVIVPVGGGGLIGGIANAVKRLRPASEVIGVEPEGADTMHRSLASGEPMKIDAVHTIADSLGAPFALPYSFGLCQMHVDRLAMVDDMQLRQAMGFLFRAMKIAVEPACAASTAALLGPLRQDLTGKRVVLVMCGSNIDWATFEEQAIFDDDVD